MLCKVYKPLFILSMSGESVFAMRETLKKDLKILLLLDVYRNILSETQYSAVDLYYNQDLSLSEIGYILGKSRQGVFDSIKRAETILNKMESSLGIVNKLSKEREKLKLIHDLVCKLEAKTTATEETKGIKNAVDELINIQES